tara:strand:+ start:6252 stop:7445 length:1194 start_codon:yes stop_codon:yes gene_type:complete
MAKEGLLNKKINLSEELTMTIYTIDSNNDSVPLEVLEPATFSALGYKERDDIQEWIDKTPGCLGEPLLMLGKEFDGFDKSRDRLDLLAMDVQGNLVVIENKRDDSGKDVVGQAIKYAAFCSTLSEQDIVAIHSKAFDDAEDSNPAAQQDIENFLTEHRVYDSELGYNHDQRIIIVSGGYKPEAISAAVWVLEKNIDITLIKLDIYAVGEGTTATQLINIDKILPSPDLSNELVRMKRERARTANAKEREALYVELWSEIQQKLNTQGISLFADCTISNRSYFNSKNIEPGLGLVMTLNQKEARVEAYINLNRRGATAAMFEWLESHKVDIETSLQGYKLSWEPEEKNKACRVAVRWEIDLKDESMHSELIEEMVKRTQNFHNVMLPLLKDGLKQQSL